MSASPLRQPYSLIDIICTFLNAAHADIACDIRLARENSHKGLLNEVSATEIAVSLRHASSLIHDFSGILGVADRGGLDHAAMDLLDRAYRDAAGLALALDHVDECAEEIARDFTDTQDARRYLRRNLDSSRDRCTNLIHSLDEVRQSILPINKTGNEDAAAAERLSQVLPVARPASRVLEVAARILPAADQVRFASEYRSEQYELALAGAGRLSQLAYAGRQLRAAWSLRAELRNPARRRVAR